LKTVWYFGSDLARDSFELRGVDFTGEEENPQGFWLYVGSKNEETKK
jgi:hypothetical protein